MVTTRNWQARAVLDWPDVDTRLRLPSGWRLDRACTSIVNSDGVAVDPLRAVVKRGARVHTAAAASDRLAAQVERVWQRALPNINYRCRLLVAVKVPSLGGDLAAIKQVTAYTRKYLPTVLPGVDPLDGLLSGQMSVVERAHAQEFLAKVIDERRRLLPERRHAVRMAAATVDQFHRASLGGYARDRALRECVQVEHSEVVWRCLAAPCTPDQLHAAVMFAAEWVRAALIGEDSLTVASRWAAKTARQKPFVWLLEKGWSQTNFEEHARRAVAVRKMAKDVRK